MPLVRRRGPVWEPTAEPGERKRLCLPSDVAEPFAAERSLEKRGKKREREKKKKVVGFSGNGEEECGAAGGGAAGGGGGATAALSTKENVTFFFFGPRLGNIWRQSRSWSRAQ